MAFDIALDDLHDVYLNGKDLALTDGSVQTLQEIGIRLQFWKGEWFLDIQRGIPYLEQVFQKKTSLDTIASLFKAEILASDGVLELLEFSMEFINENRNLRVDFKVMAEEGIISKILEVSI